MKTPLLLIIGALALASRTGAAEIPLADGRVLQEATIQSQTPRTVIVKHKDGLSSVAKELLPPELRVQYPVDEATAVAAEARADRAAEAARERDRAQAEQRALRQAELAEAAAIVNAAAQDTAERAKQETEQQALLAHRRSAQRLLARYFRDRSDSAFNYSASIRTFKPVNDPAGPFLVTGTVTITSQTTGQRHGQSSDYYQSGPGSSYYVRGDFDYALKAPAAIETKQFEAVYYADGPEPTLSTPVY